MSANTRPVVQAFTEAGFGQNGYLVWCRGTREGIIVDPGAAVDSMLAAVDREAVHVTAIVLTHAHIDHVTGVAAAKSATGAPIHLHRDDLPLYQGASVQAKLFGLDVEPFPPIDEYIAEGDVIRFGDCTVTAHHTPGHAPGHVILVGPGIALVGDCVFAGTIGRTDLPGGDFQTLISSIRRHILSLPHDTVLYSGHGDETTVGRERTSNPFLVPHFGGSEFA